MNNNFAQFMQNPRGIVLKKFMVQVMGNKAHDFDEILTRLGTVLITENDINQFGEMINIILGTGYRKAIDAYREELTKMGVQVNLVTKD